MITVLIFRDSQHYADYYYTLKYSDYESRCKKAVEKPLIFELDILNIDDEVYRQIILDRWGLSVDCPFCFWHSPAACYLRPRITKNEKSNIVGEFYIPCPHLLYSESYINLSKKRDKESRNAVIQHRRDYDNLQIDWKDWEKKLEE